jgi:thymidine phosphorylase
LAADAADGESRIAEALTSGEAADTFGEMVAALGGPHDFADRWRDRLPAARVMVDVIPNEGGFIGRIDTRALGEAVVHLGGGRLKQGDRVDPAVGLSDIARIGERVDPQRPLARIHAASEEAARAVAGDIRAAFGLTDTAPETPPLIHERIG